MGPNDNGVRSGPGEKGQVSLVGVCFVARFPLRDLTRSLTPFRMIIE